MTKSLIRAAIAACVLLAAGMLNSPATADHFVAESEKRCTTNGNSIDFACTFTVVRGPDAIDVEPGDRIHVHLIGNDDPYAPTPANAVYTAVGVAPGGTCDVTLTETTGDHLVLTVGPAGCPPDSSFTLDEQLRATGPGGGLVCQSPDEHPDGAALGTGEHAPVLAHCATNASGGTFQVPTVVGPPTSIDECKQGGWQQFNNPAFKNQGDCASFVATNGRNPAAV